VSLSKRDFLQVLGAASVAGFGLGRHGDTNAESKAQAAYDPPPFVGPGSVSLLHITDSHAQLLPSHFREPSVNLGVGAQRNQLPHRVGEQLLRATGIAPHTRHAHAFTHLDFVNAARRYGQVGGFAHIATLVKRLRASRPGALLLDGGDTWQGSATALWTQGQDMVDAAKLLGVDVMTGHWEFTHGAQRVQQITGGTGPQDFNGRVEFIAQNIKTTDLGDDVFKPYVMREINGTPVAIIGQAFPYTRVANPAYFTPDWSFGIREAELQSLVDDVRAQGAQLVVVLSHNGMDVDLKLATRVSGIDAILGGHTHDGVPVPVRVANRGGHTVVTNAGCNGKFVGVMDFQMRHRRMADFRYHLLPVFARLLPADAEMTALIEKSRAPFAARLSQPLGRTDALLYRRGNFNGSWDQLLCDALMEVQGAQIALSPGFRWGTSLLPGEVITREKLMDQTAITYPHTTLRQLSGTELKAVLEDVADNLFNPDPYYQQGGDMVRTGGLSYACAPEAAMGSRISNMRVNGVPLEADKRYSVAGWAPVAQPAPGSTPTPIWELVETWLQAAPPGPLKARRINAPQLIGVKGNAGLA
jgi:S-sulfosulfanyl-L-cysteine sulfohydrolase